LSALAAFPQIIPAETSRSSIILKYPCKVLDGPVYWAGIRATMELPELWMSLFEKCGHIPTIGVTVEEQEAKEPLPQGPSISGAMSQQLWIQCFLGHGGAWVGGDAPPTTPLPHTYEVCTQILSMVGSSREVIGMYELSPATCLHPQSSGSSRT